MQVRDNHFYQKLSVMLIYNKLMTSSVMTSFYDHVILIKKMIKFIRLPFGAKNDGEEF